MVRTDPGSDHLRAAGDGHGVTAVGPRLGGRFHAVVALFRFVGVEVVGGVDLLPIHFLAGVTRNLAHHGDHGAAGHVVAVIDWFAGADAGEQAAFVAQRLLELREEGVLLEKMAVLYRSHFHALELQLELTRRNIPYSITSGIRFFEQAHIKDVTAYLKLVANSRDELSFKRLVFMLPGIGSKGAEKLWKKFLHAECGVRSAELENPKAEDRNPKEGRDPKSEGSPKLELQRRKGRTGPLDSLSCGDASGVGIRSSDFGFVSDFGFRASALHPSRPAGLDQAPA